MIVQFITKYLGLFLTLLIIILAIFVYADLKMDIIYLQSEIDAQSQDMSRLEALNTAYRQITRYQMEQNKIAVETLQRFLPPSEVLQIKNLQLSKETIR